jgi:hypothetical protein
MAVDGSTLEIKIPGSPFPIKFQDWLHSHLYFDCEFSNGDTTKLDASSAGPGAAIPGGGRILTATDTNLDRAGTMGLSPGNQALIYSVRIRPKCMGYSQGTPALTDPRAELVMETLFMLNLKLYYDMRYNNKTRCEGVIYRFPAGGGPYLTTMVTGQEVALNGVPSPRDQHSFVLPLWLKPNIGFNNFFEPVVALAINEDFTYDGEEYTSNYVDIEVDLDGLYMMPVV